MQYLTLWDFILTPIFLIILSAIARQQRNKRYPAGHVLRQYYMPGLFVKFAGAIFIALIYAYYYRGVIRITFSGTPRSLIQPLMILMPPGLN